MNKWATRPVLIVGHPAIPVESKDELTAIVPLEEDKMFCVHCGADNPEFASYCMKCGQSVNWKQNQPSDVTREPEVSGTEESHVTAPTEKQKGTHNNLGGIHNTDSGLTDDEQLHHNISVPRRNGYSFLLILLWFAALLLVNVWSLWSQNTDKSSLYIFLEALSRMTSPLELLLSIAVVGGILSSRKSQPRVSEVQTLQNRLISKRVYILTGVLTLFVFGFLVALLPRGHTNQLTNQSLQSKTQIDKVAMNPNALDNYEILSKSNADLGNKDDGLTPEAKKMMREMFALEMSGALHKQNNPINVEVAGNNHDVLLFQSPAMNDAIADEMIKAFRVDENANFWNGMRLMDYSQVVFSGTSYKKIVTRKEFLNYGKNYEKYKVAFLKATKGFQAGAQGELTKP